ncbi:unnamed protein product [Ostreobium quekettii]|uniref:RING-type domain-containing protein n=1 Tax=Ostreobium quekettii TaxID=121088 RepID=A0A8S1JIE2_9CHLO|nr:unnamed protein product [Ostreobium quekettii]|eukprot:evm.model.scf_52.1 EVM.evm.TU.scf_52.1   scf_52:9647-13971(+)
MGNKASVPEPKQVYLAAKAGDARQLEAIRSRAGDPASDTAEARTRLLEWTDDEGKTALVVAAAKNHLDCVNLLLAFGANVQHMSRRRDGGTALHEAVQRQCSAQLVDALLSKGASPFVENASGFTALDYAIVRKELVLVRRFEELGFFRGYMRAKVQSWGGLSRNWFARWVAIVPRYSYPEAPVSERVIRRLLLFYENAQHVDLSCRVYLDGARARIEGSGHQDERVCSVMLHRTHLKPKGLFVKGNHSTGFTLFLKRHPSTPQHRRNDFPTLEQFMSVVNSRQDGVTAVAAAGAPPGESDEEFARRLSYCLNGGIGDPTHATGINQNSWDQSSQYPVAMPVDTPQNHSIHAPAREQQAAREGMAPEVRPSAPPLPDTFMPFPAASAPLVAKVALPTAPPVSAGKGAGDGENDSDDDICVICLDGPKEAGFVHGDSVHRCVCNACADNMMRQQHRSCPVCRQNIEKVLKKFF